MRPPRQGQTLLYDCSKEEAARILQHGAVEVLAAEDEYGFIQNAIDPTEWFVALRLRRKLEGK